MKRIAIAALALAALAAPALAEVTVKDAWVRATVPQQKATGAFMELTSSQNARLVEAKSPVAGVVQIHEMKMEKDVMKMREIKGLDLPAGKPVELSPGGYHVMLMELKRPLAEGETVPLTLVVESGGKRESVEVKASVRALTASGHGGHMTH